VKLGLIKEEEALRQSEAVDLADQESNFPFTAAKLIERKLQARRVEK
jgi:hypothetical protein